VKQHVRLKESLQITKPVTPINSPKDECLICQQLQREIEELKRLQLESNLREKEQERRLVALEPLLKRRVILETEKGEVTADREYGPGEAIRLRSIYRSQSLGSGTVSNDK
jgi:hypothetical protein